MPLVTHLPGSKASLRQRFNNTLRLIWREAGSKPMLGLAISGGVDSMALASLCSDFKGTQHHHPSFAGFIVDHKLREGSTEEAHKVADELRRIHIEPCILTLDWSAVSQTNATTHVESTARRLRYAALGKACLERRIDTLLVAHHADDQAETMMLRLLGKFYGLGMRGIRPERPIPDCNGVYGIDRSGTPLLPSRSTVNGSDQRNRPIRIESGGVKVVRPLLSFTKPDLIKSCQNAGVSWFEDHTNADPTFTGRNTIRHLLTTDALPEALRSRDLLKVAGQVSQWETRMENAAQKAFDELKIELNVNLGRVKVRTSPSVSVYLMSGKEAYTVSIMVTQRLLKLVAPTNDIPLHNLHEVTALLFPEIASVTDAMSPGKTQVAGVSVSRTQLTTELVEALIERAPPSAQESATQCLEVSKTTQFHFHEGTKHWVSQWHLWDNRYWIRLQNQTDPSQHDEAVTVRFLTATDIGRVRKSTDVTRRKQFEQLLQNFPGNSRCTLPVIAVEGRAGDRIATGEPQRGEVVALPSLDWSKGRWSRYSSRRVLEAAGEDRWFWDIRYKHVDFDENEKHTLVSAAPRRDELGSKS